jgi:hypothetical protein
LVLEFVQGGVVQVGLFKNGMQKASPPRQAHFNRAGGEDIVFNVSYSFMSPLVFILFITSLNIVWRGRSKTRLVLGTRVRRELVPMYALLINPT